ARAENRPAAEPEENVDAARPETVAPSGPSDPAVVRDPVDFGIETFASLAPVNRVQNGMAEFENVQILRLGQVSHEFDYDDEVTIRMVISFHERLEHAIVSLALKTLQGTAAVYCDSRLVGELARVYDAGARYVIDWALKLPLMHGNYVVGCAVACPPGILGDDWIFVDAVPCAYQFRVRPRAAGMIAGLVALPAAFRVTRIGVPKP
ncbi:MAG TPA: Wzt carbohydrate-binding domain-containing protein, partial [Rhodocyclaceae bacterium]|nr:Wzt carbohydrate-binding domain-containing protein [Rhodocyclaceae bacterium]